MSGYLVVLHFEGTAPSHLEDTRDLVPASSLWAVDDEPVRTLALIPFDDEEAAATHLRGLVESTEEFPQHIGGPPSVHGVHVRHRRGPGLESTGVGTYLTSIHAIASPGHGEDMACQIDDTLISLESLEGYTGHVWGVNSALEDEVWALIFSEHPPVTLEDFVDDGMKIARYRRVR